MACFILECTKTGRFWTFPSEARARRAAHVHGLVDYTIERATA